MKAQYYAISATQSIEYYDRAGNRRIGMDWSVLAGPCDTRADAEAKGVAEIGPLFDDDGHGYGMRYAEARTLHKNLKLVPKSQLPAHRISLEARV